MYRNLLLLLCIGAIWDAAHAADPVPMPCYVFRDGGDAANHFVPSGWMGDVDDLQYTDHWTDNCYSGDTCIRIHYTAENSGRAQWAGIYWQEPEHNWGVIEGGYNLSGAYRLAFWARGQTGDEVIRDVVVGGIRGRHGDTARVEYGRIELSRQWQRYTVSLRGANLRRIIGGFGLTMTWVDNPLGATIFLDDIRFEGMGS